MLLINKHLIVLILLSVKYFKTSKLSENFPPKFYPASDFNSRPAIKTALTGLNAISVKGSPSRRDEACYVVYLWIPGGGSVPLPDSHPVCAWHPGGLQLP
ncbi:hypothetical protein CEXT_577521 [Caerostris extrusa]|uniref:Uncharacterized protein n=1 Tax=Caerostris extrusa TaxID=172846 RepID=A0AAV4R8Y3_CAEEX|nr:hypothetical protein CEXT_577521 [Caerostris extrusa]